MQNIHGALNTALSLSCKVTVKKRQIFTWLNVSYLYYGTVAEVSDLMICGNPSVAAYCAIAQWFESCLCLVLFGRFEPVQAELLSWEGTCLDSRVSSVRIPLRAALPFSLEELSSFVDTCLKYKEQPVTSPTIFVK